MSLSQIFALFAAATAAGAVNAIAGGGTLITFPVLLLCGPPPVIANATSTVALVIGTAGSIFGFRQQISAIRPYLLCFIPVSLAGGLLGSALLTQNDPATFTQLVPWLILFATTLFLIQGFLQKLRPPAPPQPHKTAPLALAIACQFPLAVYGGYFGAGIGILMLASFGFLRLGTIHQMNALKNILGSLLNFVAATWFVASGLVDWPKAGILTLGALLGYYTGATYSQRIPASRVRLLITVIGILATAAAFWNQFS
ncbi:MAG: sulfite exporter TauE/SafE family protein [Verrucomicrobia bacterium]|nr:sulfite exporter TauE/SafE family protein [Verrucomicrobiota bacterium]